MVAFSRFSGMLYGFVALQALGGNVLAQNELPSSKQAISERQLLLLHEIGGLSGNRSLSVSPDGRSVAFQIHDADFDANTYKQSWFVSQVEAPNNARHVGAGGEPMLSSARLGRSLGALAEAHAEWSPDGQWIAYLRQDAGRVQIWRVRADGTREEQVTHSDATIERFRWKADGTAIYYEVGRSREAMRRSELQERATGQLLDDRFVPYYSLEPLWFACGHEDTGLNFPQPASQQCTPSLWITEFDSERQAKLLDMRDYESLSQVHSPAIGGNRRIEKFAWNASGTRAAWLENENTATEPGFAAPLTVHATGHRCNAPECTGGMRGVWWYRGEVIFRRWEGHANSVAAIYAWRPEGARVRLLYRFDGTLDSCDVADHSLVCLYEAPTSPRKVVAIDLRNGVISTVFDPNLEFRRFDLGTVKKLEWTDGFGNEAFGHLVYPPGYQAGQRYPLVIVQYSSRGFLKGGTGEEYPIYPLAAAGFLVLSSEMPEDVKRDAHYDISSLEGMESYARSDWGDAYMQRRSLSALEIILDRLESEGVVDADKVGITGLSNGALVVDYALINSKRFSAAAISGSSTPDEYLFSVNDSARELTRSIWPRSDEAIRTWKRWYVAYNAQTVTTPLLMQVSDRELIPSLAEISGLKDAGAPVEAYVFPDEYHIKWQPQHKMAVGQRAIDWFRFWLENYQSPEADNKDQYVRWHKLKEERDLRQTRPSTGN